MTDPVDESNDLLEEDAVPLGLTDGNFTLADGGGDLVSHRLRLTFWLIGVSVGIIAVNFAIAVFAPASVWERTEKFGTVALLPFQTLVGTAIGWYFGEKRASR